MLILAYLIDSVTWVYNIKYYLLNQSNLIYLFHIQKKNKKMNFDKSQILFLYDLPKDTVTSTKIAEVLKTKGGLADLGNETP